MKQLIIASTSTVHGGEYLGYLLEELAAFFHNTSDILFIPFARPSGLTHDEYTEKSQKGFKRIGKTLIGLHTFDNKMDAIKNAKGIFTGGGNTFVLLDKLYEYDLIPTLRNTVLNGIPYLGTSAGSNICGLTIKNTNDMPIVYPPSFQALAIVPFNINPHFLDPDPLSKHMGETRETRIQEFHHFNTNPVIGLREGSWLQVDGQKITLKGNFGARIFEYGKNAYEVQPQTDLGYLK